ncbi:MAG TPA: FeoA family protein, partial [Candidatus Krumholzibacteria bacterium]
RIDGALGFPTIDPHGAPSPGRDGSFVRADARPLVHVSEGESVVVVEVDDRDPAVLRYLAERRMYPGTGLDVVRVEPFGGSLVVRVDEEEFNIGRDAAADVRVTR